MKKPSPSSILRKASVKECVTEASHSAGFVVSDLQPALAHATGTEAIVILGIIDAATELKRRIDQLDAALEPEVTSKSTSARLLAVSVPRPTSDSLDGERRSRRARTPR